MAGRLAMVGLVALVLFAPVLAEAGAGATDGIGAAPEALQSHSRVQIELDLPKPGAVLADPGGLALLAGRALAFDAGAGLDLVIAIDTSDSTDERLEPAPVRGKEPGAWKRFLPPWPFSFYLPGWKPNATRSNTVLAAEIALARELLSRLDPRITRVGLVTFAGDWYPATPDSLTEVPLTSDFTRVRAGLRLVEKRGPEGFTNAVSGVRRGVVELIGTPSARGVARARVDRVVLLLTDGRGLDPFLRADSPRERAAEVGRQAQRAGVRVDVLLVGEESRRTGLASAELAQLSGGRRHSLASLENLAPVAAALDFTRLDEVVVRNRSLGRSAAVARRPDGRFASLVPLQPGRNELEVSAQTLDGARTVRRLEVSYAAGGDPQEVPPELVALRGRLLQVHLERLQLDRLGPGPQSEPERSVAVEVPTGTGTRPAGGAQTSLQATPGSPDPSAAAPPAASAD